MPKAKTMDELLKEDLRCCCGIIRISVCIAIFMRFDEVFFYEMIYAC